MLRRHFQARGHCCFWRLLSASCRMLTVAEGRLAVGRINLLPAPPRVAPKAWPRNGCCSLSGCTTCNRNHCLPPRTCHHPPLSSAGAHQGAAAAPAALHLALPAAAAHGPGVRRRDGWAGASPAWGGGRRGRQACEGHACCRLMIHVLYTNQTLLCISHAFAPPFPPAPPLKPPPLPRLDADVLLARLSAKGAALPPVLLERFGGARPLLQVRALRLPAAAVVSIDVPAVAACLPWPALAAKCPPPPVPTSRHTQACVVLVLFIRIRSPRPGWPAAVLPALPGLAQPCFLHAPAAPGGQCVAGAGVGGRRHRGCCAHAGWMWDGGRAGLGASGSHGTYPRAAESCCCYAVTDLLQRPAASAPPCMWVSCRSMSLRLGHSPLCLPALLHAGAA